MRIYLLEEKKELISSSFHHVVINFLITRKKENSVIDFVNNVPPRVSQVSSHLTMEKELRALGKWSLCLLRDCSSGTNPGYYTGGAWRIPERGT